MGHHHYRLAQHVFTLAALLGVCPDKLWSSEDGSIIEVVVVVILILTIIVIVDALDLDKLLRGLSLSLIHI